MFILHGPTYRYSGEILLSPEIIYVQDHHHDPDHGYAVEALLANSQCDPARHLMVFDHVNIQDHFVNVPTVCLPLLLAAECHEFNQQGIVPDWRSRTHAFNFAINKPRPNRQILLDMVDELSLRDYRHSLCWQSGYGSIAPTHYRLGPERTLEQGILNGSIPNSQTYADLLKSRVFEPTSISLITEPAFYERETIITEKTLMAIWAGTIPIWVGGWRCADFMRASGFDVFDDMVDHGYQSLPGARDRCQRAVLDNQHLLRSITDLSCWHDRLEHNLGLLKQNVFWHQIQQTLERYPMLTDIVRTFRGGMFSDWM